MSFSITIENIYKVKGYESLVTGKIEKCDDNISIQDGQSFNIEISSGYIGKGLYPVYGHKTRLLKINEYFTIAITSKINIPFQIGDIVIVTL